MVLFIFYLLAILAQGSSHFGSSAQAISSFVCYLVCMVAAFSSGATSTIRVVAEGVGVEWTQHVSRPEDAQGARACAVPRGSCGSSWAGRWCNEDRDRGRIAMSQGREAGGSIAPAHALDSRRHRSGHESGSPGSNKPFRPWEICSV